MVKEVERVTIANHKMEEEIVDLSDSKLEDLQEKRELLIKDLDKFKLLISNLDKHFGEISPLAPPHPRTKHASSCGHPELRAVVSSRGGAAMHPHPSSLRACLAEAWVVAAVEVEKKTEEVKADSAMKESELRSFEAERDELAQVTPHRAHIITPKSAESGWLCFACVEVFSWPCRACVW